MEGVLASDKKKKEAKEKLYAQCMEVISNSSTYFSEGDKKTTGYKLIGYAKQLTDLDSAATLSQTISQLAYYKGDPHAEEDNTALAHSFLKHLCLKKILSLENENIVVVLQCISNMVSLMKY